MTLRLRALCAAWLAFAPVVMVANVAVEAVPNERGIAFVQGLRYAVLAPACGVGSLVAALLCRYCAERSDRPRRLYRRALFVLALVVVMSIGVFGTPRLLGAAVPVVVSVALALSLLIPRFAERPPRLAGTLATSSLGVLAILGVLVALRSERVGPPGRDGRAFDVPRSLLDADHNFISLPSGARVHYVDVGSGETLLFLHGNPAWLFQWRDLIAGLRDSFRCVALDYPGFGMSTAPPGYGFTPREQSRVLEEFVHRLGLRQLTLVMQDWGGPIGLGLAGRRPELVHRLVLGNTWAWPTSTREPRGIFSKIAGGPIGEFVQMNFNGIASFALEKGVVRRLPEDVTEMYIRPFRPLERRGVAAFYPGQITAASEYMSEVESSLGRLRDRRALIFWGMRDPGFPPADLERFQKAFPSHKTIELADADHFFFEDAAGQMVVEIRAFAEQDAAEARRPSGEKGQSAAAMGAAHLQ